MAMTASEARKNLFPLIEQVNNDRQPIEITSMRGDAVLMSRADYEASRRPPTCSERRPTPGVCSRASSRLAAVSASHTTCCSAAGLHATRLVRLPSTGNRSTRKIFFFFFFLVKRITDSSRTRCETPSPASASRSRCAMSSRQLVQADRRRASLGLHGRRRRRRGAAARYHYEP